MGDAQLDAMHRQLEALWAAINRAVEREHFPPRTGPLCDYCSFQPICPAFASEDAAAVAPVPAAAAAS